MLEQNFFNPSLAFERVELGNRSNVISLEFYPFQEKEKGILLKKKRRDKKISKNRIKITTN